MIASNAVGGASAILFAIWLLSLWLTPQGGQFGLIFGFSGVCFLPIRRIDDLDS